LAQAFFNEPIQMVENPFARAVELSREASDDMHAEEKTITCEDDLRSLLERYGFAMDNALSNGVRFFDANGAEVHANVSMDHMPLTVILPCGCRSLRALARSPMSSSFTWYLECTFAWADYLELKLLEYGFTVHNAEERGVMFIGIDGAQISLKCDWERNVFPIRVVMPRSCTPKADFYEIGPPTPTYGAHSNYQRRMSATVYIFKLCYSKNVLELESTYGIYVVAVQNSFGDLNFEVTANTYLHENQVLWCGFLSAVGLANRRPASEVGEHIDNEMRVPTAGYILEHDRDPDRQFIGRRIGDLNIRSAYGVAVLGIAPSLPSRFSEIDWFPAADKVLENGCELLVTSTDLTKLHNSRIFPSVPAQDAAQSLTEENTRHRRMQEVCSPMADSGDNSGGCAANKFKHIMERAGLCQQGHAMHINLALGSTGTLCSDRDDVGSDSKIVKVCCLYNGVIATVRISKTMTGSELYFKVKTIIAAKVPCHCVHMAVDGNPLHADMLVEKIFDPWPLRREVTVQKFNVQIDGDKVNTWIWRQMFAKELSELPHFPDALSGNCHVLKAGKQINVITLAFCLRPQHMHATEKNRQVRMFVVSMGSQALDEFVHFFAPAVFLIDPTPTSGSLANFLLAFPYQGADKWTSKVQRR